MHAPVSKKIIVVCGPTAAGKTAAAIALAKALPCEIVNADSRQVYAELNIGVAKPSAEELNTVKHHLIGTVPVTRLYGAGDYEKDALAVLAQLFTRYDTAIVCGGTGMYLKALCEGLDDLPRADEAYRAHLLHQFHEKGIIILQEAITKADSAAAAQLDMYNPQRLMRALEIMHVGGKKYSEVMLGKKAARPFTIVKTGINTATRDELYHGINARVDGMMQAGLLDEVKSMLPYRNANALKTVGYKELFDYIDGHTTLAFAIDKIKQHTRNYAKRQLTWFNADKEITWFTPAHHDKLISFVSSKLS